MVAARSRGLIRFVCLAILSDAPRESQFLALSWSGQLSRQFFSPERLARAPVRANVEAATACPEPRRAAGILFSEFVAPVFTPVVLLSSPCYRFREVCLHLGGYRRVVDDPSLVLTKSLAPPSFKGGES